jgi:hypothetical protein
MGSPRTPAGWLVQAIGLCVMAVLLFASTKPSPTLAADLSGFDHSPTCRGAHVVTDTADDPLAAPAPGRCVVQLVRVTNKRIEHHAGRHSSTTYWVTLLMPWHAEHEVSLRGAQTAYNAISIGHPLNALVWSRRLAFLAVNGQPISTAENPDVEHRVQIFRWCTVGFLLFMGLVSVYRAVVG